MAIIAFAGLIQYLTIKGVIMPTTKENIQAEIPMVSKKMLSMANNEVISASEDACYTFVEVQLEKEMSTLRERLLGKFKSYDHYHQEQFVTQFITHDNKHNSMLTELLEELGEGNTNAPTVKDNTQNINSITFKDCDIFSPGQVATNFPRIGTINTIKKRVKTRKIVGY